MSPGWDSGVKSVWVESWFLLVGRTLPFKSWFFAVVPCRELPIPCKGPLIFEVCLSGWAVGSLVGSVSVAKGGALVFLSFD